MLGAGIALFLADRLDRDQRKAVSVTLALIDAVTSIPAILVVFAKSEGTDRSALNGRWSWWRRLVLGRFDSAQLARLRNYLGRAFPDFRSPTASCTLD